MTGIVFDIKEFAINDGGGIRTTVFLKGCPLRCVWCHNPEGLSPKPEIYIKHTRCLHCGLCKRECTHSECQALGRCLHICPNNLVSVAGKEWESDTLAEKLLKHTEIYTETGGGITLSGGEPLLQAKFTVELLSKLKDKVHTAIETSGYADGETFRRVVDLCDFVYMDLKIFDRDAHKEYTGVDNEKILANAEYLKQSGKPHTFRTPLIPDITDTEENLKAIEAFVGESPWEKLAYNALAAAKYASVGREFKYKRVL